jgi:hypothetical protein
MTTQVPLETLRELLNYDPTSGALYWRVSRSNRVKPGGLISKASPSTGYIRVTVDKKCLAAHRVAWALATGKWPEGVVDHINGVRTDNRIANLRDVTRADNVLNRSGPQRNKKAGDLGVFLDKRRGTWYAQLQRHGKTTSLGTFMSQEEAAAAANKARKEILGGVAYG